MDGWILSPLGKEIGAYAGRVLELRCYDDEDVDSRDPAIIHPSWILRRWGMLMCLHASAPNGEGNERKQKGGHIGLSTFL
jgi:hypothetical protein